MTTKLIIDTAHQELTHLLKKARQSGDQDAEAIIDQALLALKEQAAEQGYCQCDGCCDFKTNGDLEEGYCGDCTLRGIEDICQRAYELRGDR